MKKDAVPFAVTAPRRVPLPMQQQVKEELERLEDLDIIRPMPTPTDWCAPIVVVPKANNKVRVCVDLTKLNESVRREHFPLPTTNELLAQLSGATTFSKLDCNSGFYQIPLAEVTATHYLHHTLRAFLFQETTVWYQPWARSVPL